MKYTYLLDSREGVRWHEPIVDWEDDFDNRRMTESEYQFSKVMALREEQYSKESQAILSGNF